MFFRTIAILIASTAPLIAQSSDAVTSRAQSELEKSLRQLDEVRKNIDASKVPLVAELNRVEAQVKDVTARHDAALRTLDTRNLEAANLNTETQNRANEVQYLSNVLNEYVLGLKTAVHASELEKLGPLMDAAENAAKNETMEASQKFEKQVAVLDASLKRLENAVGGHRFEGEAVDKEGRGHSGKFALVGPLAFFAASGVSGVAQVRAGEPTAKPVVLPLPEPAMNTGISTLLASGEAEVPFDITRGAAFQALMNKASLWKYYKQGGPIMHPILVCAIIGVAVTLERLLFVFLERLRTSRRARKAIFDALEAGDINKAATVSAHSKDYIARMLTYALSHREKSLSDALQNASGHAIARYHRGIVIMETVITLAPLLGLLGTVTGMMGSFGMLGGGEISGTTAITGGIAEALIATAAGLGIAIVTVIPMNWLVAKQEAARHEIEDACTKCELLGKPLVEAEARAGRTPVATEENAAA